MLILSVEMAHRTHDAVIWFARKQAWHIRFQRKLSGKTITIISHTACWHWINFFVCWIFTWCAHVCMLCLNGNLCLCNWKVYSSRIVCEQCIYRMSVGALVRVRPWNVKSIFGWAKRYRDWGRRQQRPATQFADGQEVECGAFISVGQAGAKYSHIMVKPDE